MPWYLYDFHLASIGLLQSVLHRCRESQSHPSVLKPPLSWSGCVLGLQDSLCCRPSSRFATTNSFPLSITNGSLRSLGVGKYISEEQRTNFRFIHKLSCFSESFSLTLLLENTSTEARMGVGGFQYCKAIYFTTEGKVTTKFRICKRFIHFF